MHNWTYDEVQYCVDEIIKTFVVNKEYNYEVLLDKLFIHFDMKIKKGSLKMFFSNIKYLLNKYNIQNTLSIAELKNVSQNAVFAFNAVLKKYSNIK